MLIDDYFEYQINFEKKYGKKTIVLMQVGSFFEFYGVNNEQEKIGDPQVITELLNIQLTRRNKQILENSRSNCLMAGFPTHSLKRFINILLGNNYTVILIEQVTEPPNPKREITQIFSPGTYIDEINKSDPNYMVSIYITEEKFYKNGNIIFSFGISSIDLSTGQNVIYESNTIFYEKNAFMEEIYRFVESFNPKEIIVNIRNIEKIRIEDIKLKLNGGDRIIHYQTELENKYININYQNTFLKKIFPQHGFYSPIEYIDLEKKPYALISFIILLQFSYEHNERIVEKIKRPESWEYNSHLILYNNAIHQLNIIPFNNNKSLFDIIQKTSTSMGRRLLKYRIINPITDIKELNKRYDLIDLFYNSNKIMEIEKVLNEIVDIERFHRKISLQMLHPYEFLNLSYSYDNIENLIKIIRENFDISVLNINTNTIENFCNFRDKYLKIFDMVEIGKHGLLNIGCSFFKKNNNLEIDEVQGEIDKIYKKFELECNMLSNMIEEKSDFVKVENNERDGFFYYTTKKRSDILISKFSNEQKKKYEIKKYNGANIKIVSDEITKLSTKLVELKDKIKSLTKDEYLKTLIIFDKEYMDTLNEITNFVALIDVIKCSVLCAKKYRYNRPEIVDENNGKSYFNVEEIRHPIIEVINEEIDYVKNDLELYHTRTNGILLYGVNGAGKSSLSKAVGCNIVLAQMGFFVPSKKFKYYPYKKIFTRINGDDNIFKGMSSFAVEMDELRSILKYSDDRSIVLGDEICKGTEETSALSIVSASIMRFCEKNVNFIMATHFHKLCELECMKNLKNIKFKHLTISYNSEKECIIYGRKLEEGPGDNLYGIEIANYIIDDKDFINNAKKIRNIITNTYDEIIINKTSNYNNKLYVECCSICGDKGITYPLDTHHIIEQNEFEKGDYNKDKLSNLVILCKKHHDEVHYGDLVINGYIDTIKGRELEYYYIKEDFCNELKKDELKKELEEKKNEIMEKEIMEEETTEEEIKLDTENNNVKVNKSKRKKYTDEEILIIKDLIKKSEGQINPYKYIICEYMKQKGIRITKKTIEKINNNEY
jgi:DNA mismatch repair protein MutS